MSEHRYSLENARLLLNGVPIEPFDAPSDPAVEEALSRAKRMTAAENANPGHHWVLLDYFCEQTGIRKPAHMTGSEVIHFIEAEEAGHPVADCLPGCPKF